MNVLILIPKNRCKFSVILRHSLYNNEKRKLISPYASNMIKFHTTSSGKDVNSDFAVFRVREELKQQELSKVNESNSSRNHKDESNTKVSATRNAILNAALNYVPKNGWSKQSIAKGAISIEYPAIINGLFPLGGIELVHHFYRQCNNNMVNFLKEKDARPEEIHNLSELAQKSIEMRLRMVIPYIRSWPQAMGLMALPSNMPTSLANMLTLIDDICYYAGDRSVDFSWYVKRIGLASIYQATELYMMQDTSADYEKTWKFLERRIDEARMVHDFLAKTEDTTSQFQNAVGSAISTARNILGLNLGRR
ncbi:ubiquinone biosynthesis protein COQ9, mitochondrial-like isoform X2 [Wyeomyia smithii]|uniref:ubiquinone biosynthesis protein COQ9, mitochondrial-like isoform X2 n=1 Tax=Wyeomyia smithii TaxID=174621 RepID=UPI0024680DEC|nr:ubiquinone biosynthesis protein COQ9, mitochondrial-like isoform X2 [Wyeomyia smithii]